MGKYSKVLASALKNATNTAIGELTSNNFEIIQNNLNNPSCLRSSVNTNISNALEKIIQGGNKGSVFSLKKRLETLVSACEKIEQIQRLENEITNLKNEVSSLEKQKYNTTTYTYRDSEGNVSTHTEQVLNQGIVSLITRKKNLIQSKTEMVKNLEVCVDGMLN